jgi:hypothetical protein
VVNFRISASEAGISSNQTDSQVIIWSMVDVDPLACRFWLCSEPIRSQYDREREKAKNWCHLTFPVTPT